MTTMTRPGNFVAFLEKTPYGNFFKILFRKFMETPIDVVMFKCRKICPTKKCMNSRVI